MNEINIHNIKCSVSNNLVKALNDYIELKHKDFDVNNSSMNITINKDAITSEIIKNK